MQFFFSQISKETQNFKYGKISRLLGVLHTLRCFADYDMEKNLGKNDFLSMLAQLDDLKKAAQELKPKYFNVSLTPDDTNISETVIEHASIKVFKKEQSTVPVRKKNHNLEFWNKVLVYKSLCSLNFNFRAWIFFIYTNLLILILL